MPEIALFSRKIYTAGTNFTRPPVATVATNLNSAGRLQRQQGLREEGETSFQQECNPRPNAQETCPKNGCHVTYVAGVSPSLVPQPTCP